MHAMPLFQHNLDLARLSVQLHQKTQQQAPPQGPPYKCVEPGCDRAFNRKYTLSEHAKTHTGDKPFVCSVASCSKRFTTTGNLSRHRRLHGPVLPLECPVGGCPCTFSSELKLEKHMKFHFGTSVHLCDIKGCGKTFSTVGNLNRHMRNQHNVYEDQSQQCLSISTPLCRSPKSPSAFAQSPTGTDDWLFSLAGDDSEDELEANDDVWILNCVATNNEPMTAEEAAQDWDPEVLEVLSVLFDGEAAAN
ncbi:Zinc finger protein [Globisporangium polare]